MNKFNWPIRLIVADLGINVPFVRGKLVSVRNCWHFSTDGKDVDYLFLDEEDFVNAMNRIYIISRKYNIVILAFCLMDNHLHFVLWGEYEECNRFMHEYVRCTSLYISRKYGDKHKMLYVPIDCQVVDNDLYLKTVICYVIKNPSQAGLPYTAYDYPWSSGALYMRAPLPSGGRLSPASWVTPKWIATPDVLNSSTGFSTYRTRAVMRTRTPVSESVSMIGDMIFPGEYVAYELVNEIYKTHKSFNYFLCVTKDSDVESKGGVISRLSIPNQEMRQHKASVCKELFGVDTVRTLSTEQRLKLVKVLRSRYNSSPKQLVKMCGLVYARPLTPALAPFQRG